MNSNTEEKSVRFTTVDEVQQHIIDSFDLEEPTNSQVHSFANYLNLPWNDLGEFTSMVQKHEDEFQKHFGKLDSKTRTKEYVAKYPFHIFNYPITEAPWDLKTDLDLGLIADVAVELSRGKQWIDFKDYHGHSLNVSTTFGFLEKIFTRIFNLEILIPYNLPNNIYPERPDSIPDAHDYDKLSNMTFKTISLEDCFNSRFEIYFHYLKPQTIFRDVRRATRIDLESLDDIINTDQHVNLQSILTVMNCVEKIFYQSISSNKDKIGYSLASRLSDFYNEELLSLERSMSSNDTTSESQTNDETEIDVEKLQIPKSFIRFFNQRTIQSFGKPYMYLHLRHRISKDQDFSEIFKASFKFALFEIKYVSMIGDLAKVFFSRLERSNAKKKPNRIFLKDTDTGHVDKSRNVLEDKDEDFEEFYQEKLDQFNEFVVEAISHCKTVGCPVTILTNGDDYVFLFIEKFFEKLENGINSGGSQDDIFGDWRVCIVKKNEYPIIIALSSIFLSMFNDYISHRQLTNFEILKWYQSKGKVDEFKILDMNKYLINRKVFYDLFYDRVINPVEEETLNVSWTENDEICLVLELANPSKLMNQFVKNISQNIKQSYISKRFHEVIPKESPFIPIEIFHSQDFQIVEIFQNELIGKHPSATLIHATYNQQIGVLKMFDITRMTCFNKHFIQFKNGYYINQDFSSILGLCFKMFMSEYMAYNLLGEKEYLPKIYHSGLLYMPNLSPSTSIQEVDLYEDPFSPKGKNEKIKSDSMFIFMETVEEASFEGVKFIDLLYQALKDLEEIHSFGVIHRDINRKNIIFKESKTTETGLRVVFLDFGLCHIMKNGFKHKSLNDKELEKFIKKPIEWRERRQEFIYEKWRYWPDEEIDKLNDKEQEILYERLRVIDREDLKEALALEMIG